MSDSIPFKSKLKFLIISGALIFVIKFLFHYFYPAIPISQLGPSSALPPILGLMFGPWGAAGSALGYLFSEISVGYPPQIFVVTFIVQFLYAYIPYKLWYTLKLGEKNRFPRLDTVKHLIKFVVIMFINAIVMAGLLGLLMDFAGFYDLVSLTTLVFALNNFDFTIMVGSIIIIFANFYGISMYKPKTVHKPFISPKLFDILALVAIIIAIINGIYSIFEEPDFWGFIASTLSYLLILLYVLKPVTREFEERRNKIKVSLTEKLILIFIITGAIIAAVTGIISYFSLTVGVLYLKFWESIYLNITIILSIFYISSIGFLWYIEKNITTPIESISDIARNYVNDKDGMANSMQIISQCEKYAAHTTEVGILALSFQKMIKDIKRYVENLEKVTAERERLNTELDVARKIQRDMLPKNFPDRDEFELYALNLPAKEVGGDFYDFFMVDENKLAIIIGDVSGKGIPAALFMAITKTLIKNQAQLGKTPSEVFSLVNNQLYDGNDENMFVTAWMGVLEVDSGNFSYVNAGHNPPLFKHSNAEYKRIESKPGFVLAAMQNIVYGEMEIKLDPGDRIFLYTDGISEATNKKMELYGETRLKELMNSNNGSNLHDGIKKVIDDVKIFMGDEEQFDDITMLILEYKSN